MAGDYVRFTHKPRQRYSGVLMQQGRVQLDSDINEQVEIIKRRWELQAQDTFGKCAVPTATTPDGFKITGVSNDDFTIGVGRMYVDGLLAENFDEDPPVSYLNQPFYPLPPLLSDVPSPTLIYLDVWDREVTWLQDRRLLEVALLGPDTGTRIQTVWQVKAVAGDCERGPEEPLLPSAGRLSSRAVPSPSSDDPCILPPAGGFRGLENRLYRVEIHDPGNPQGPDGLASVKFKWSRDNASVASPVEAIDAVHITVSRIGRDKVLRFQVGDWVEVLDDTRELMELPGEMARILAIDEANRILTLHQPVNLIFDATQHTRVTRWDQKAPANNVDANGLMAASNDWIPLEDGVEILLALDSPSGAMHVADYWVFSARTADGSVEELDEAPPRGIIHHYCHLAELPATGGEPEDCRHRCNPCGGAVGHNGNGHETPAACSVTVPQGFSIQAAIDSLAPEGGCVCLKNGDHTIIKAIEITQGNLIFHGEGLATRIVGDDGLVKLLQIKDADTVRVHDISFDASGVGGSGAVIEVERCHHVSIDDCRIAGPLPSLLAQPVVTGVAAIECHSVDVHRNELQSVSFGVKISQSGEVRISENRMTAPAAQTMTVGASVGSPTGHAAWQIEGNLIEGFKTGVFMQGSADRCVVEGNVVFRESGVVLQPSPNLLNPLAILNSPAMNPAALIDGRIYGIDLDVPNGVACRNTINLTNPSHGGIRTSAVQTFIEGNIVSSDLAHLPASVQTSAALAILLGPRSAGSKPPDESMVRGNVLHGRQDGIVVVGAGIDRVHVQGNQIGPSLQTLPLQSPRLAIAFRGASAAVVEGNEIQGAWRAVSLSGGTANQLLRNHLHDGGLGVLTYNGFDEAGLEVSYNRIENMEGPGIVGARLVGSTTLSHNRIVRCGQQPLVDALAAQGAPSIDPPRAGLFVESDGHVRLESCELLDTGVAPSGQLGGPAVGMHIRTLSCRVTNNRAAYSTVPLSSLTLPHRALLLVNLATDRSDHAAIAGNSLSGPGLPHLVEIGRVDAGFGKIQFSNNHCQHATQSLQIPLQAATVSLKGRHLIVMGNHVEAMAGMASMNFNVHEALALIGNITTGALVPTGPGLKPSPSDAFNIVVP